MTGLWAERIAALWLQCKGWRIVARRLTGKRGSGVGEVDLIAKRGKTLAFVEIKYRPTLDQAAHAIQPQQRQRIVRAAKAFLSTNPDYRSYTIRFDAVLVASKSWPLHIQNAWPET
jgi:putative endonuclease